MNEDSPLHGQPIDLGKGSIAWSPCHIGKGTQIGNQCSIGSLAHVGRNVSIGDKCRIQGGAYIADGCTLEQMYSSDQMLRCSMTNIHHQAILNNGNPFESTKELSLVVAQL